MNTARAEHLKETTSTRVMVELAKWFSEPETPDTARAKLFGVMVQLATPLIEHYHGDLYRDAEWVRTYVTEPTTFYYGAGKFGTNIGVDRRYVEYAHTDHLWLIDVLHTDEGIWLADIERLA